MDAERIVRARTAMAEAGLDVLVCRLPENLLFLTGFLPLSGMSFLLFPREGEPVCIIPECERDESLSEMTGLRCPRYPYGTLAAGDMYASIARLLEEESRGRRWRRVGIEAGFESMAPAWNAAEPLLSSRITMTLFEKAWGQRSLTDATGLLYGLRARKTPAEAALIRRANEIACFGLAAFRDNVAPGRTAVELVAEVERAIMTRGTGYRGAKKVRAFAQVAAGREETAQGWRPMEVSSPRSIELGDLALLELGVMADGYWSDRTRVRTAGEPAARHREVHACVLRAQQAAVAAVRPGVAAREVDAAARRVLDRAGLQKEVLHITGHGTGFRYHEPIPAIAPESGTVLEEGMVFTVEPGVYAPELGGLRLEDNVLVTATGCEVLGPFDAELAP